MTSPTTNGARRTFSFLAPEPAPLVRFEPRGDGREVALIGVVEVGEIGPYNAGAMAYWRVWLPGCGSGFGRAGAPKAAREYLIAKIEQWIEAAGLVAEGRAA